MTRLARLWRLIQDLAYVALRVLAFDFVPVSIGRVRAGLWQERTIQDLRTGGRRNAEADWAIVAASQTRVSHRTRDNFPGARAISTARRVMMDRPA